jgi:phosphatidylserine/phosphatidylglycerophosphate/cardiolipin synthase-like enzyme
MLSALNIRPPQSDAMLAVLGGRSAETVVVTLDQVLAQRASHRIRDLEVVWTGPEPPQAFARDTASVVRELFRTARETVLIAGYSFDHGKELLRPLCEAIRDRDVTVTIFLNTPAEEPTDQAAERAAAAAVQRFVDENWPDPRYLPALFYDPRTARKGPPWVSLHAKCLVADRRRTLITSANFTDRGQTRSTEAGVLIHSAAFGSQLTAQWNGYRSLCRRWPSQPELGNHP